MAKRIFILMLALLCVIPCVFGCSGSKKPAETTPESSANTNKKPNNNKPSVSKNYYVDYEPDDLPEDLDYGKYEFRVLCDADHLSRSFVEKPTGETVTQVVYERMTAVEKRLGVLLDIDPQKYIYGKENGFMTKIDTSAMGGTAYDLVISHPLLPALLIEKGLICNLYDTQYFNPDKPWWSSTLLENIAIDGKIYFTADNSSWNNLRNMMAIFVDRDIFGRKHPEMQIDDLYNLVQNNEWTMEKMFELTDGVYEQVGTKDSPDANDIYGLSTASDVWLEGFFYSAGFTTSEKNSAGEIRLTLMDNNIVDFTAWFIRHYCESEDIYRKDPVQYGMFLNRKTMFYQSVLSMVEQKIEQTFTVLPMPMYISEEQGNRYYTHFCNYYDMYSIPSCVAAGDRARSSAVMECLASEAFRRVAPTYFEIYLKSRNVFDGRMSSMYDKIRESIVFDIGYVYGFLFDENGTIDMPIYSFRRSVNNNQPLTAFWTEDKHKQYTERFEEILDIVRNAPN